MTAATMKMRRALFRSEEPEWLVWLLVIVMLGIGLLARTVVVNQTDTFNGSDASVSYPAGWIALQKQGENELLNVGEPFDATPFPARFTLLQLPIASTGNNDLSLGDFALKWADRVSRDLLAYKVLGIEPVKVRGRDAVRVDYVYVAEPALPSPNSIPIVAHGADILIPQEDTMKVARLVAASGAFDSLEPTWDRILGSLELK